MEKILKEYNSISDDFYYHHTITDLSGESYYHGMQAHRQCEVLYLISGELSYIIEGETYKVSPGDIIFVSPNELHTLRISGDVPYERMVILFEPEIFEKLLSGLDAKFIQMFGRTEEKLRVITEAVAREYGLKSILSDILSCEEPEPYKRLSIALKIVEFIIRLDKISHSSKVLPKAPISREHTVKRIIDYVNLHILESITLESISAALFISKSTICHKFASYMNMTLNRYIAVKKIFRADEFIRMGHGVQEAARMLGYDNYTTFYYNYKQIMGYSPTSRVRG